MERVFFPFDAELKNELDEIKLAIQGEQNGMASYQMGQMAYKKNYGVSYVALRNIARQYQPNKKLAFCLWNIGYRETMLLSLLLMPAGELDEQEADNNFLNMDPDAVKESLTSSRNKEPSSIQIICRTEEISVDEDAENAVMDAELPPEKTTFTGRIAAIFKTLWGRILGLFGR